MSSGSGSLLSITKHNSVIGTSMTKVNDLISQLDKESIHSCAIGISKMLGNQLDKSIAHGALLLSKGKAKELDMGIGDGILIEYGYYSPNENSKEEDYVRNGYVIYRQGDKGGLRYYMQSMSEFKENFCSICYICLDINKDNQKTFSFFIDEIAPIQEEKWTKDKYHAFGAQPNNCQTFVSKAIEILKPEEYSKEMIKRGKNNYSIDIKNFEDMVPKEVLNSLKKFTNNKIEIG